MRGKGWAANTEKLREIFERSIKQAGEVKIYGVLNHVSASGMTRWISLYVPLVDNDRAIMISIASERKVEGCGMDMGFALAYDLYTDAYPSSEVKEERPYQKYLKFAWL